MALQYRVFRVFKKIIVIHGRKDFVMAQVNPLNADSNVTTYQPLLDPESSLMVFLGEPAITTITFFKNADATLSSSWLKDRLTQVCKANPWLTGRLIRDKKIHKNVLLEIPRVIEADVDSIICNEGKVLSGISSQTKYEDLVNAILKSNAVVGPGYKLIGQRNLRVAKFTMVPVSNGEVALIFSLTHTISDGFTYYKILSMLSGEIEELSSVRKHDYVPASIEAIGVKEDKFLKSTSFLLCCLKSMLCGSKANMEARYIDPEAIRAIKTEAKHRFISTNDIITSTFARATDTDILLMAINLRSRVKGTDSNDAGNYELVLTHDAVSASTPEAIRKSLQEGPPFKRDGDTQLPGFFKTIKSKVALITNWSFPTVFKADLKLFDSGGAKNVPIHLHLPVYNPKDIAFPLAIIFRPKAEKLAILFGGSAREVSYDKLVEAGAPIGEPICNAMFPAGSGRARAEPKHTISLRSFAASVVFRLGRLSSSASSLEHRGAPKRAN